MLYSEKHHIKDCTYIYTFLILIIFNIILNSYRKCEFMKCLINNEHHNPPYPDEYLNITNPKFYKSILSPKLNRKEFDFFISIPVAPYDFDYRDAIRKTWKNNSKYCISFFFMGISNCTDYCAIKNELKIYNDIVQFNFINSYLNLTLLTILSIYWVVNNNFKFKYYMKIDRDTVPNLSNIFNIFKMKYSYKKGIFGKKSGDFIVNRNKNSSSYIPYSVFKHKICPSYIYGMLYIIDYNSLIYINNISMLYKPLVYREDVHLGILCRMIRIEVTNIKNIIMKKTYNYSNYCKYYAYHSYKPKDIRKLFRNNYICSN